ncbi:MAG: hypothetical protein KGL39_03015 [Patescibacteria group bacterium]|nr:hypothetical protein [Patescibacteria group bacterium]
MLFELTSDRQLVRLEAADLDDLDAFIDKMQAKGELPQVTQGTLEAMKRSLARYFDKISSDKIQQFADEAKAAVESTLKTMQEARPGETLTTTVGESPATARTALTEFLEDATGEDVAEKMNVDFFLRVAKEVAEGAGNFVAMNSDPDRVDEYPAVELVRVYPRKAPRGTSGRPGDDDWPTRFEAAGGILIEGRMVALKDDPVWDALGDGEGGYDDALGNPFPPFAFNSGMDWDEVARDDAEELGLLDEGEEAKGAEIDDDLFSLASSRCLVPVHVALAARRLAEPRCLALASFNRKRLAAAKRRAGRPILAARLNIGGRHG